MKMKTNTPKGAEYNTSSLMPYHKQQATKGLPSRPDCKIKDAMIRTPKAGNPYIKGY